MSRAPLRHYLKLIYPLEVAADPDGGYVVTFPDLPGCMTQVETLEELPRMSEGARAGWIETEYERGNEIPMPSVPSTYSGRFNLRIPRSLHRSLALAAEREGVSLNQYVLMLLSRGEAQGAERRK